MLLLFSPQLVCRFGNVADLQFPVLGLRFALLEERSLFQNAEAGIERQPERPDEFLESGRVDRTDRIKHDEERQEERQHVGIRNEPSFVYTLFLMCITLR